MTSPATSCAFLGIGFRETWPPRNTEVQPFAVAELCARAVSPLRMRRLQESRPGSWFRRPSCGFHGRRNGRRCAGHGACLRKSGVIHSCRVQIPGTCMAQVSRTCDRLAPYRRSVMTPRASCSPLWRQPPEQSHHPAAAIPCATSHGFGWLSPAGKACSLARLRLGSWSRSTAPRLGMTISSD